MSAVLLLLAGCSTTPLAERERAERAQYMAYSGDPIREFTYFGRLDGWTPVGRDKLVVWTGVNDAYLLTVWPTCTDLQFATHIGLNAHLSTVSTFDSVRVGHDRCPITEIRPVDYRQLRADARAAGVAKPG
jgi:hypothetical protein